MRLLNTQTFQIDYFYPDDFPPYGILSHTWGRDEVTFQDMQDNLVARSKDGFSKIAHVSELAHGDGLEYVWIDTVCIDKTSSAELSEAINSMWSIFEKSEVCFVYLADVQSGLSKLEDLKRSRWFTRGWTLMELLAPSNCRFYAQDWSIIDNRTSLRSLISETTGIGTQYLLGPASALSAPISTKMKWLSRRMTTRVEDLAYCALGLFDINMPMLYGEGSKAFIRLQEEILKAQNDPDIFNWFWDKSVSSTWSSVFAPRYKYFNSDILSLTAQPCTQSLTWQANAKSLKQPLWIKQTLREFGLVDSLGLTKAQPSQSREVKPSPSALGQDQDPILVGENSSDISDAESEVDSLFTDEATVSTRTSYDPIQTIGIQEVSRTLLSVSELEQLCRAAITKAGLNKSRAHIKGFLQEYGDMLNVEARNPIQGQAAKFIYQLAGRLADEIRWYLNGDGDRARPVKNESAKKDLEDWLSSVGTRGSQDQYFPHSEKINTPIDDKEDEMDEEDISDDEIKDSVSFPKIEQVNEFLIYSEAFRFLIDSLRKWLKIDADDPGNLSSPNQSRLAIEPEGLTQGDTAPTGSANDEFEDSSPMNELGQNYQPPETKTSSSISTSVRKQLDTDVTKTVVDNEHSANSLHVGKSNSTAELDEFRAALRFYQKQHNVWINHLYSFLDFWGISWTLYDILELFTPGVTPGHARLRWRCSCGTVLWGDFAEADPEATAMLKTELDHAWRGTHGATLHQNGPQISLLSPGGFSPGADRTSIDLGTYPLSRPYPAAHFHGNWQSGSLPSQSTPIDMYVMNLMPNSNLPVLNPRYFEICVNTGNHKIDHFELDISNIRSDSELFEMIWDKYNASRGFGIRRFFLRPKDVHFVLFSIGRQSSYGAGIHDKPKVYPPEEEVEHKRYHYLAPKRIMPAHVFLHFLHKARWSVWGEHREDIWLQRLPKKLNESILVATQGQSDPDLLFGWGVHIIDGANHSLLGLLLAVLILITFIVSVVVYGIAHTQEQAFGIGSYLIALVTCLMGAIYFKLTDQ